MKLFDLQRAELKEVRRVILWHLGYMGLVALFFSFIYYFGYFKTSRFLKESPLFTYFAPLCTLIFTIISPWRGKWLRAIKDTHHRLEGEPVFCLMGFLVFVAGFFIYSVFIWGLAALGPSLFYM